MLLMRPGWQVMYMLYTRPPGPIIGCLGFSHLDATARGNQEPDLARFVFTPVHTDAILNPLATSQLGLPYTA